MDGRFKIRERENRRGHILDAARGLFAELGFSGTTMDQVARASGFTKRTVYGYFASKEELWCGVAAQALNGMAARFLEVRGTRGSGLDQILGIGHAFECFAQEEPTSFLVLTEGKVPAGLPASGTRGLQELGEAHGRMHAAMAGALRAGLADGSIRPDLDPDLAAALLATYSTAVMQAVHQAACAPAAFRFQADQFMSQSLEFIGHALRAPSGKE